MRVEEEVFGPTPTHRGLTLDVAVDFVLRNRGTLNV